MNLGPIFRTENTTGGEAMKGMFERKSGWTPILRAA